MEKSLAERIQDYMMSLLGRQVSILDENGKIISSTIKSRIGETVNMSSDQNLNQPLLTITEEGVSSAAVALTYNNKTKGFLLINEDPEKFSSQSILIKSLGDLLVQQYHESLKPELDSTDKFICQLLYTKDINQFPYLASQAQILGYGLDIPRMAFVIHLEGFWNNYLGSSGQLSDEKESIILRKKRDLESTIANFFTKDTDNISAYMGEDKFVIFKDIKNTPEEKAAGLLKRNFKTIIAPLQNAHISSISAGIGNGYPGIIGLVKSYKEANSALTLGRKMWGNNRAYIFDDLGLISVVGQGNREKKLQFAQKLLSEINNTDLLKTLESFFKENLNLTQTSESLGIHRNTVIYRLDQISKILGKDPRNFEEAVEIKIALLVNQLLN